MTRDQLLARKAELQVKLKARDGKAGFKENVAMIRARLAEIEQELSAP